MDGDGSSRCSSPSRCGRRSGEALEPLSCCGVAEKLAACGWPPSVLSRSPCLSARAWGLHVTAAAHRRRHSTAQQPGLFTCGVEELSAGSCGSRPCLQVGWGPSRDQGPVHVFCGCCRAASAGQGELGTCFPLAGWRDGSNLRAQTASWQTLSPSTQCLPPLCPQVPAEGPCRACTPSPPGKLCP